MGALINISQNKFAGLVGVSQQAIQKAIRSGIVYDEGKGIDLQHPTNVEYAEKHAARREAKGRPPSPWTLGDRAQPDPNKPKRKPRAAPGTAKRGRPPKPKAPLADPDAPTPRSNIGSKPGNVGKDLALHAEKLKTKELDRQLKMAKLEQERIKLRSARRRVISTATVAKAVGRLGGVLEDHFRSFGERNGAAIVAAVLAGEGEGSISDMLDTEIDKAVSAFKRSVIKEIENMELDTNE